jgi:hypothetical protein
VICGGYRPDAGVRPVGVDGQQEPLEQGGGGELAAVADRGEGVQAAGAQRGLGQHVQQRDSAPAVPDRGLEPPQVARLGHGVQVGEDDRPGLGALPDVDPVQLG